MKHKEKRETQQSKQKEKKTEHLFTLRNFKTVCNKSPIGEKKHVAIGEEDDTNC
jgi:hypothetical protein